MVQLLTNHLSEEILIVIYWGGFDRWKNEPNQQLYKTQQPNQPRNEETFTELPLFVFKIINLLLQKKDTVAIIDRKQKEKLQRYNAILDAAEKILKENGLHSLNIELVAKETELAKGTLYLYFKSKEELIGALSIKSRILLLNHFKKATKKIDNPIEKLKAISYASFDFYKKYPFYFDLIAIYEVNNKLEETEEIQTSINKLINFVNEITFDAKKQDLLNPNLDPVQYTFCLWGMLIGMAQLVKVRGAVMKNYLGFTEKDIVNTFMQQLEMGMKK